MNKYSGLSDGELITLATSKAETMKNLAKSAKLYRAGQYASNYEEVADAYKEIMAEFNGRP